MAFAAADRKASEVPEGSLRLVRVNGVFVLLSNVGGQIYATSPVCPHAGAALNYGILDRQEVICPLHSAIFDVITGEVVVGPADHGLACYPVQVDGDTVLVDLGQR